MGEPEEGALERLRDSCRVCLRNRGILNIYSSPMLDKLLACTDLEINIEDGLPESLCRKCSLNLNQAFEFRVTCEKSDKKLQNLLRYKSEKKIKVKFELKEEDEEGRSKLFECAFTEIKEENNERKTNVESMLNSLDLRSDVKVKNPNRRSKGNKLRVNRSLKKTNKKFISTDNEVENDMGDSKLLFELGNNNVEYEGNIKREKDLPAQSDNDDSLVLDDSTLNETVYKIPHQVEYACNVCERTFTSYEELNVHSLVHKNETYSCSDCKKIIKGTLRIEKHKNGHIKVQYPCEFCGRVFHKYNIRKHVNAVHLKIGKECTICHKMLSSSQALKGHIAQTHEAGKEYICNICVKTFKSKMGIWNHMKTHTERSHSCAYCEKKFVDTKSKKEHERLHTGERPYKCPICDKGFAQRGNMKSHFEHNHRNFNFAEMMKTHRKLNSSK